MHNAQPKWNGTADKTLNVYITIRSKSNTEIQASKPKMNSNQRRNEQMRWVRFVKKATVFALKLNWIKPSCFEVYRWISYKRLGVIVVTNQALRFCSTNNTRSKYITTNNLQRYKFVCSFVHSFVRQQEVKKEGKKPLNESTLPSICRKSFECVSVAFVRRDQTYNNQTMSWSMCVFRFPNGGIELKFKAYTIFGCKEVL